MKKTISLFTAFLASLMLFSQADTLVMWSFSSGELSDTLAEVASELNVGKYIFTDGGVSAISMKNGYETSAAQATDWEDGIDIKAWQISVNTTGYTELLISSLQTAGGSDPGPRDFKIQYKEGEDGNWVDVENGTVTVANDWVTGVVNNLPLPAVCEDHELIYIRWVVTSNMDIYGNDLLSSGKGKIDNILLTGTGSSAVNEWLADQSFCIYPNPFSTDCWIESSHAMDVIEIIDQHGQVLLTEKPVQPTAHIHIEDMPCGIYFLRITNRDHNIPVIRKIVKR